MITGFLSLFELWTIGFWILMAVCSIIFIAAIENDKYFVPAVVTGLLGLCYWKSLASLQLDWRTIGLGALIYIVAGIIWSVYRWYRYVHDYVDNYKEKNPTFKKHGKLSESDLEYLKSRIDVTDNKSRICTWIGYWPWSLVWHITGDLFNSIYKNMKKVYQKIVNHALSNISVIERKNDDREVITDAERNWVRGNAK